jgi:hypothetical protein
MHGRVIKRAEVRDPRAETEDRKADPPEAATNLPEKKPAVALAARR